MKVFITGGLGQIGSHIAEMLLERGDEVMVIDNLATGRKEHLKEQKNLQIFIDTIADKELVEELIGGFRPDAIVHTAASYKDPDDWYNDTLTNCVGGSNVINAAKKYNVGRFIYFQTALCYGLKPTQQPVRLDHPKNPAGSSYAISKTANEDYLEISGLGLCNFQTRQCGRSEKCRWSTSHFLSKNKRWKEMFYNKIQKGFCFCKRSG